MKAKYIWKIFCLLLIIGFPKESILAQGNRKCYTDKKYQQQLQSNNILSHQTLEKEMLKFLNSPQKDIQGNTIIIPVVFHIIHNGDPYELIQSQLDQLNADFSSDNNNLGETPDAFKNAIANMDIQFCLTELDQNGLSSTGINRYHINNFENLSEADCWTPEYLDENIVKPTIWDREDYLNIYSVIGIDDFENQNCNFFSYLGYAQYPGGSADTDAVVVSFYTLGSLENPNPLVDSYKGRTLTHEVGHWLNLFHLWGEDTGGCNHDDSVNDTPMQSQSNKGCPNFPLYDNCTNQANGIMFMNFMDYTDDACMTLFTKGQKARVQAAISTMRSSLIVAPCAAQSVLSISSLDLDAIQQDHNVLLTWNSVDNSDGRYQIEYKFSENEWSLLSTVENFTQTVNLSLSYLHNNPGKGIHYYRIKFLSDDEEYSSSIKTVFIDDDIEIVFPIPATDFLNITNPFNSDSFEIQIFSIQGKTLYLSSVNSNNLQVDISNFPSGIYILLIQNQNSSRYIKWIKS